MRFPVPAASALRLALALAGLAGVVLLVLATFTEMSRITNVTVTLASYTGWDHHGPALLLLAAFAALMLAGALRGSRPAMLAVAAAGVATIAIALLWTGPSSEDLGEFAALYEDPRPDKQTGYFLETLGGVLLLVSGGGMALAATLLPGGGRGAPGSRRRPARERSGGPRRERAVAQADPERQRAGDDLPV